MAVLPLLSVLIVVALPNFQPLILLQVLAHAD